MLSPAVYHEEMRVQAGGGGEELVYRNLFLAPLVGIISEGVSQRGVKKESVPLRHSILNEQMIC